MQVSQEDVKREAARIAKLWIDEGLDAAASAFGAQCRAWDLLRWQQSAFAAAVREAKDTLTTH